MKKKSKIYIVTKNGKEVFRGNGWACYKYVLDNQPLSTFMAERNGWSIKKIKEKE
jgi:hypothetical protein